MAQAMEALELQTPAAAAVVDQHVMLMHLGVQGGTESRSEQQAVEVPTESSSLASHASHKQLHLDQLRAAELQLEQLQPHQPLQVD